MTSDDGDSRGRVVVVGSLNVDSTSYVAAFPEPGETIRAHGFQVALGGKGANQAVAVHVAGVPVEFIACIGDDANGAFAQGTLERLGLPVDALRRIPEAPTGAAQITVADSGENTVIITGGANLALTRPSSTPPVIGSPLRRSCSRRASSPGRPSIASRRSRSSSARASC